MRVAITGACGRIGRCLMAGLLEAGHDVIGIDVVAPGDVPWAARVVVADLATDDPALSGVLDGSGAVVHLAANAGETDFATAVGADVELTHRVLETMSAARVGRMIYASSNHAVGFTPRSEMLSVDTRSRPDSFYGIGKVAGEALCSLFHDRLGIEVACLRIGSFLDQPLTRRHLATWLSPGDTVRLVGACLTAEQLGFTVAYGISANSRRWWSLDTAWALGYEPADDAEEFAARIEAEAAGPDDDHDGSVVGGEYTRLR